MEQINAFQILDPRFRRYALPNALLEKLYSGARWADEHGARRVTRTELDGSITNIVDRYEGRRLNSPNDVVVRSDGTIWFTDPIYGISAHYEGAKTESEIGSCNVYRFDPVDGRLRVVADDFTGPNGLAFSRDGHTLYVADSGSWADPTAPHHIRSFAVTDAGHLTSSRVLIKVTPGAPDGLRVDVDDNVWAAAGDGIHCIAPDGTLLGKVIVPETCGNICFGGRQRNRLYICGFTSLYAIYLNCEGLPVV